MPSPGLALLSLRDKSFWGVSCRECWPCLTRHAALTSFRRNLSLVKELGDRAAQGRAYGNLGNTQYLLGNFSEAIAFHKEVGNRCAAFLVSGAEAGCRGAAFLLACCTNSCQAISCSGPSAPNERFEGRVLLAWKPKEMSKGKLQLGLARLFCS